MKEFIKYRKSFSRLGLKLLDEAKNNRMEFLKVFPLLKRFNNKLSINENLQRCNNKLDLIKKKMTQVLRSFNNSTKKKFNIEKYFLFLCLHKKYYLLKSKFLKNFNFVNKPVQLFKL